MGKVNILVAKECLSYALHLNTSEYGPVNITNVQTTKDGDFIFILENENFPEREPGSRDFDIPHAAPTFRKESIAIIDWNIKKPVRPEPHPTEPNAVG